MHLTTTTTTGNYGSIVSAQLIGSLLQFLLGGMLCVQVYIYYLCFPQDSRGVKLLVYFTFLLVLARTVLTGAEVEFWFGSGFGNIQRFVNPHDLRVYTPLIGPLVGLAVELFFSYRIVALRASAWWMALPSALITLGQCACGISAGILFYLGANEVGSPHHTAHSRLARMWLISGVTSAVLVSLSITYILLTANVVPTTRTLLRNLIWLTVETNAIAATAAVIAFSLQVGCPGKPYWICPAMLLPGLYANTLLATLNNRALAHLYPSDCDADADSSPHALGLDIAEPELGSGTVSPSTHPQLQPQMTFASAASIGRRPSIISMRVAAALSLPDPVLRIDEESLESTSTSASLSDTGTGSGSGTDPADGMVFAELQEEAEAEGRASAVCRWPRDGAGSAAV
ncbi:hypothetical protein MKEN_00467300 [Mycena kentingensis (nom. inval.)]|nr:hypothetical protein MKEN_00467300 [Mycena kentingensis (nom. inval.)]